MLDLLNRLVEVQGYCDRVNNHPQLTSGEKTASLCSALLVRECLPQPVLDNYDRMQSREPELLHSPDLFAMAVLVAVTASACAIPGTVAAGIAPLPPAPQGMIRIEHPSGLIIIDLDADFTDGRQELRRGEAVCTPQAPFYRRIGAV